MLIEKLQEQQGFTNVEKSIADYLLSNGFDIKYLSISQLAEATYSSPATIVRLCRKLGTKGYKEFRILFNTEFEESFQSESVDSNVPFGSNDSYERISRNLCNLTASTINGVQQGFDFVQMKRIVARMDRAETIKVFSIGISMYAALDFKAKMVRLGRSIVVEQDDFLLPGHALSSGKKTFCLLISQSGETEAVIECARILRERGSYSVALTAHPESRLASLCDEVVLTSAGESDSFSTKIESFASFYATHYVLDCLYCWLFRANYAENAAATQQKGRVVDASHWGGEKSQQLS